MSNSISIPAERVNAGDVPEKRFEVICGDCLEVMPILKDRSVDVVICDLPYGTTSCAWDIVIPLEPLWREWQWLLKPRGAIVLFGSQPFTTLLISSNLRWFKYSWVWDKVSKGDVMNAKNKPLKQHEDICVFSEGTTANGSELKMPYFPQGLTPNTRPPNRQNRHQSSFKGVRPCMPDSYMRQASNYPTSILTFSNADHTNGLHPTQKPLALLEYLVLTYTQKGETVLDNTMGSGTTGAACLRQGRRFIGIERDPNYFEIARQRLEATTGQFSPREFGGLFEQTP